MKAGEEMEIYLNNAATSHPKPEAVYQAMNNFMRNQGVSYKRGKGGKYSCSADLVEDTRGKLAQLFNIQNKSQIVFTKNATEALNLALKGLLQASDHVIYSNLEHNSVLRPLAFLEKSLGISKTIVQCSETGELNPEKILKAIQPNTRLIALTHASNVLGTILPIAKIGEIAKQHGILFLVDTAQTAGIHPIDVEKMQIDLLAFSGHKGLLGPQGTGGLYIREDLNLVPLCHGGTGGYALEWDQPLILPDRYESGTLNGVGITGLHAGIQFILEESIEKIRAKELQLTDYLLNNLLRLNGITIYGTKQAEKQTGVVSFNFDDLNPIDVGYALQEIYGIIVRTGLHCSPMAHQAISTLDIGTIRIGLGYFNTQEDIDCLIEGLKYLLNKL